MKLTQKRVKELIILIRKDRNKIYHEFKIAYDHHLDFIDEDDILIIEKYYWLGGQLYAYQKILQIMRLKVK